MLEFLKNPERIRKAIVKEKNLSEQELAERVAKKREEFYGLIDDAAALYSLARELGVEVEFEEEELKFTSLGKLSAGMQGVNLHAKVTGVLAPREFERNGRKGKVCNISLADDSGEATLVLWNKDVELVEKGVIEKGDSIDVLGAYVKDSGEVHVSMGGQVVKVSGRADLPEVGSNLVKIREMKEGMGNVDFTAEVLEVGPINSFEKEGRKKYVASLLVSDGSGEARLTLWESNAELAKRMRSGDMVKVENAYVRKGMFGEELHADWRSRVIINPKNAKVPKIEVEMTPRIPISELRDGMTAELEGTATGIEARSYEVCGKCRGIAKEGVCSSCGSRDVARKFVARIILRDSSGEIDVVLLGKNAKDFLGVKEIPQDVDASTVAELKRGELVGRRFIVRGDAKVNRGTNALELAGRKVV